jgi:hypothetical protein
MEVWSRCALHRRKEGLGAMCAAIKVERRSYSTLHELGGIYDLSTSIGGIYDGVKY